MRALLGVSLAAGLAAMATAAWAGPGAPDQVSVMPSPPGAQSEALVDLGTRQASRQESYDNAIMMLKKKMDRLTREDGGRLSAAHQASLQKELDQVNHNFRNDAR